MRKKRKNRISHITVFAGIAGILVGIGGAVLTNQQFLANNASFPQSGIGGGPVAQHTVSAEEVISAWPARSQRGARDIISKYGLPDEVKSDQLVWQKNSPWKKTVVYKEGVDDNLPGSQPKVLEQTVNYRIPDDQFSELVAYSSSIKADRDRGELVARSDSEALNFLITNLANDMIMDGKSIEQAREEYAELGQKYMNGEDIPYTQKLQFNVPPAGRVRDPGETIMQ